MSILVQNQEQAQTQLQISQTKQPLIIVSLFCCGKTYLSKHSALYSICDLDDMLDPHTSLSTQFHSSPQTQISTLNSLLSTQSSLQFILVAPKYYLLHYIQSNHLSYVNVFPDNTLQSYNEWNQRNISRNTIYLWNQLKSTFYPLIYKMKNDRLSLHNYTLSSTQYLADIIL